MLQLFWAFDFMMIWTYHLANTAYLDSMADLNYRNCPFPNIVRAHYSVIPASQFCHLYSYPCPNFYRHPVLIFVEFSSFWPVDFGTTPAPPEHWDRCLWLAPRAPFGMASVTARRMLWIDDAGLRIEWYAVALVPGGRPAVEFRPATVHRPDSGAAIGTYLFRNRDDKIVDRIASQIVRLFAMAGNRCNKRSMANGTRSSGLALPCRWVEGDRYNGNILR